MTDPAGAPAGPKRRILFIERAFQFRFIAKMTAIIVLGTALTGGLLYVLADREFGRAFYSAHYQTRSSWELLLPAVLASSFVSMCLVAAVSVVLTLYDSHRIGGPLYRFKMNLEAIGRGDLTLVTRLRQGDELRPLTSAMNEMTRNLLVRIRAMREAEEGLRSALTEARAVLDSGRRVGPEDLERLGACAQRLHDVVGAFQVGG